MSLCEAKVGVIRCSLLFLDALSHQQLAADFVPSSLSLFHGVLAYSVR
jgi:hypothetical protein